MQTASTSVVKTRRTRPTAEITQPLRILTRVHYSNNKTNSRARLSRARKFLTRSIARLCRACRGKSRAPIRQLIVLSLSLSLSLSLLAHAAQHFIPER